MVGIMRDGTGIMRDGMGIMSDISVAVSDEVSIMIRFRKDNEDFRRPDNWYDLELVVLASAG